MTTIQEKRSLKHLHYYNEMSSYSKQLYYPNIQFLGIEYIYDNLFLRFKLENGKQIRRPLDDKTCYYEHIQTDNYDKITDVMIKNIKFDKIEDSEKALNDSNARNYS
jgi:hypothetical protein